MLGRIAGDFFARQGLGLSSLLQIVAADEIAAARSVSGITIMLVMNWQVIWHIAGAYVAYAAACCLLWHPRRLA
jgi:hypothetical protein